MFLISVIIVAVLVNVTVSLIYLLKKDRRSFIIGSQAYGSNYRTAASDTDIILFVSEETGAHLRELHGGKKRIKSGNIDLIIVTDKKEFDGWHDTTNKLINKSKIKEVSREEAKTAYQKNRGVRNGYL